MRNRLLSAVLLGVLVLATASPAVAGKPSGAGKGGGKTDSGSSISLDQSGPFSYGQAVTFTVETTATDRPFSEVLCSKDGSVVYQSTRGHFQDYYDFFGQPIHYLSSLAWGGGDADCVASLVYQAKNGRMRSLASTSFHVSG